MRSGDFRRSGAVVASFDGIDSLGDLLTQDAFVDDAEQNAEHPPLEVLSLAYDNSVESLRMRIGIDARLTINR